jgi:hypothetical protein
LARRKHEWNQSHISFFVVGRSGNSGLAAAAGGIWIANGNLVMQNSSMWNNSHAGSGLLQEESNTNAGRPFEALAARKLVFFLPFRPSGHG